MMESRLKKESPKNFSQTKKIDTKEFELPETLFVSDIDTKIFQGIVSHCLSRIDGIMLAEGNFISSILGRSGPEVASGIFSEQDSRTHSVSIKIEVNVAYGIPIPAKAEEIQSKVVEEITRLTGLRLATLHIVFKNIISPEQPQMKLKAKESKYDNIIDDDEYNDDF